MPRDWSRLPRRKVVSTTVAAAVEGFVVISCLSASGCVFCDAASYLLVYGRIIDERTGEPVSGAAIGGRTFTNGEETDYRGPTIFDGSPQGPVSGDDGAFEEEFGTMLMPCVPDLPHFPLPDRVEIIVVRNGCEQTFSIEINDETADYIFDPDPLYNDVIELKVPILVPPCEK